MNVETIETLSLSLADIVRREQDLMSKLDGIRSEKMEKLRAITQAAGANGSERSGLARKPPKDSKKDLLRQHLLTAANGTKITVTGMADMFDMEKNIASAYLGMFFRAKTFGLKKTGKGQYVIERG